jgi:hypothetical protein
MNDGGRRLATVLVRADETQGTPGAVPLATEDRARVSWIQGKRSMWIDHGIRAGMHPLIAAGRIIGGENQVGAVSNPRAGLLADCPRRILRLVETPLA